MAYSDYGGYAFCNGKRVINRSDGIIMPDNTVWSSPGVWPGFAMIRDNMSPECRDEMLKWPRGHVILGDGPVFVILSKQSYVGLYRGQFLLDPNDYRFETEDKPFEEFVSSEDVYKSNVDGILIEVYWRELDNYYQFVRMSNLPSGNVWCGFSGYGVGAGLEEADYGFSTPEIENEMWKIFGK